LGGFTFDESTFVSGLIKINSFLMFSSETVMMLIDWERSVTSGFVAGLNQRGLNQPSINRQGLRLSPRRCPEKESAIIAVVGAKTHPVHNLCFPLL
jgi:hypothetical protein